jgi:VWFA-related protein
MGFAKKVTIFFFPFLLLTALIANAQDQKDSGVTFTSRTNLVLVPVVVSDKPGTHISGLTKDDFEIQEDGKSKPVATLEEIKTFTSRATRSTPEPGIYTNALIGNPSPKRLTIFALDLVNTPFLDQTYAREQLIKYLAQKVSSQEPSALLAIRSNGLQVLHDFSSDPTVLVAALKKATGETSAIQGASASEAGADVNALLSASARPFNPDEINGEAQGLMRFINGNGLDAQVQIAKRAEAIRVTLQAFQHVAEAFAGIPGRKSLVWATASFPFGLDAASGAMLSPEQYRQGGLTNAPLFGDRRSKGGDLPSFPSITEVLNTSELTRLAPLYERTLQMLNDANIAVYPVDARGLVVFFPGANVSRIEGLNSFNATLFEGSRDTMVNLAAMTGGQAFYNRNDLDAAFQKAADDAASYYMLGYYLAKNDKPGWHKLRVNVKRNGSEVRARSGFFVTPDVKQEDTRRMDVSLALVSPLDYTAVPLAVHWSGVKANGAKRRIHFEITLPPDSKVVDASQNGLLDLEVVAVARTATGKPADQFTQRVQANLKGGALQESQSTGLNYNNDLILPAGGYSVRFVVRDNLTGRLGSVTAPLQVMP